jgi:uncharacterized RDD family membrane protein YckC
MPGETLTIETPEHVELHFALASVGNRFLACAIDHVLQVLAILLVVFVASVAGGWARSLSGRISASMAEGGLWVFALATLAVFVLFFGYFTIFETLWNGQTPGKRWLRLRVIQEDGRPITFFAALSRNLIRGADMMPTVILPFYSIGIISVFASGRSQRIGDLIAGTVVIKERSSEAPSFEEVLESEIIDSAMRRIAPPVDFTGDVRAVSGVELEVVEAFLRRRTEIPDHPRQWLAWRIAAPLMEKLRANFDPADFNYEGFLEELLARHSSSVRYRQDAH